MDLVYNFLCELDIRKSLIKNDFIFYGKKDRNYVTVEQKKSPGISVL